MTGVAFNTVSLNPQLYLPWLKGELEKRGITFIRKKVYSIGEAAEIAGPKGIVINATALGRMFLRWNGVVISHTIFYTQVLGPSSV